MTKIKLCGMMRPCDIDYANEVLPDYVGFIFANTRRKISMEQAEAFREALNDRIDAVGVFYNEKPEVVLEYAAKNIIQVIQLHGDEDKQYIENLRSQTKLPIWKAVKVRTKNDLRKQPEYGADLYLLDTYKAGELGGCGEQFDWSSLRQMSIPYFLAGGITPENVTEALKYCPYGIDVSSGIESNGQKDRKKMIEIVRRIRNV